MDERRGKKERQRRGKKEKERDAMRTSLSRYFPKYFRRRRRIFSLFDSYLDRGHKTRETLNTLLWDAEGDFGGQEMRKLLAGF